MYLDDHYIIAARVRLHILEIGYVGEAITFSHSDVFADEEASRKRNGSVVALPSKYKAFFVAWRWTHQAYIKKIKCTSTN
jgi:hypothetical protein